MNNKVLITVVATVMVMLLMVFDASTNVTNVPTGYTGAPGEQTCGVAGCHNSSALASPQFSMGVVGTPSSYTINQQYSVYVNLSASAPLRSFQFTAVDANGNGMGTLSLVSTSTTALASGSNGRQYVTPDTASSLAAWPFQWTAPSAYIGKVYFYATGLGANNNGTETGDIAYYLVDSLAPAQASGGVVANFTASSSQVCLGDSVTFTDASQGTVSNYNWDFGTDASPATATTVGPHTVTYSSAGSKTITLIVDDGASAFDTMTQNITVLAGVTADAGVNDTICLGDTVTLLATGGSSYTWSNGPTTDSNTVAPIATTTYTVTVSDGTCSATDQVTVVVNPLPNVSAGPDTIVCFGDTVVKIASGADTYFWNIGASGAVVTGVPPLPGVFPLAVLGTDLTTGCSAIDTAIITVVSVSVILPDTNACAGSTVVLDAGNAGSTYLWSTADTTQTISVTTAGSYSVTVTSASGCTAIDTADVLFNGSLPVTLSDTTICAGDSVVLDAGIAGASYTWSTADTTQTIQVGPGNYSLSVSLGGCTGNDAAQVFAAAIPPLDAGADTAICAGETVSIGNLDSAGVGTYLWTPFTNLVDSSSAVTDATPTSTTTYVLTASANGCSASDSVTVTVNPLPIVTISGLAGPYCENDTTHVMLTGTPGGTFNGNGVSGTYFQPSAAGPGTFNVTYAYTDGNGCSASDTASVTVNPLPGSNITNLVAQYCIGQSPDTLIGTPAGGTFFGTALSGANVIDPGALAAGTYTIGYTYSDSVSCTDTFIATIDIVDVTVSFSGLTGSYCASTSGPDTLTGTPGGGTFSGPGIVGNVFNPMLAGAGTHTITYTFDTLTCSVSASQTVTVDGIYITTGDTTICAGETVILVATGGSLYNWSTGATGVPAITVTPTDTTMYVVTGTSGGGCTSSDTVYVNVNPAPTVSLSGLNSLYCSNQPADTLVVSPSGGTFSGGGLTSNVFDPGTAPSGGPYAITYTYTNTYGCTDSAQQYVTVVTAPAANISGLDTAYCLDALPVTMVGTPTGGTFYGDGVSGNTFVPYYAGVGYHTIVYYVPDLSGYGCDVYDSITVHVKSLPTPSFNTLAASYCVNASAVTLVGSPTGGVFSGPGVSGTTFDPAVAGVGGPYIIRYTYTNTEGCSNSVVQAVEVVDLPTLNWVGVSATYCKNDDPVILSASPSGGTFAGDGVNANEFDPNVAGAGTHTLTYTYSNGQCTNTLSLDVEVFTNPTASINNLDTVYCENADLVILDVTPVGGAFSGIGTTGGVFDPGTAGAGGPYTVSYTYTDGNGCSSTESIDVVVNPSANTIIRGLESFYCAYNNIPDTIYPYPVGGTLTGAGVEGNTFNANEAGAGTHIIQYEYTNSYGCTSYSTWRLVVDPCVGIDDPLATGEVSIYPNPTNGMIYISLNGISGVAELNIYNINGQLLNSADLQNIKGNTSYPVDLSQFGQGVYLVRISTDKQVFVQKVVLQ